MAKQKTTLMSTTLLSRSKAMLISATTTLARRRMHQDRKIPMAPALVKELKQESLKSNSVWVFAKQDGDHLSYNSFRSMWRIIETRSTTKRELNGRELVERTLDFDVHPHLLRHTCITRWFEQGLDLKEIQRLAGHASLNITLNVYTHYGEEERFAETAAKIRSAM